MIVYDVATKVLNTEIFSQNTIANLIFFSDIAFIVLVSQVNKNPLRWKEINTHMHTVVVFTPKAYF